MKTIFINTSAIKITDTGSFSRWDDEIRLGLMTPEVCREIRRRMESK
jgi:hypothetical protein